MVQRRGGGVWKGGRRRGVESGRKGGGCSLEGRERRGGGGVEFVSCSVCFLPRSNDRTMKFEPALNLG